ncbi:hypothetical protein RR45_GL000622 [Lactococcus chungangensis CAU 28 = DSM 22330]|uniref:Uncharacterized protein n=1 Tax=Pseudolactococcus chungangensis CAU 28 = DSM 22330 TaxID=1122154 RepID=A0ABX4I8J5_9LACT|nr:hypothetical protein RR45_GL000622 [Lactococcus chungangensis CAU 28 = DSM 22330]
MIFNIDNQNNWLNRPVVLIKKTTLSDIFKRYNILSIA